MKPMWRLTSLLLICLVTLTACAAPMSLPPAPPPTVASSGEWPTTGWSTSTPEAQGMDSQKLAEMLKAIEERGLGLHSLLIIRNGYLISENYFGSYDANTRHQLYSVTKSVIATLIGIALDQGYIKDTDQRIVDFFPEHTFANLDEQKSHRAGVGGR
jgi:CubicO group peptidase (beta-lactamase class C family)